MREEWLMANRDRPFPFVHQPTVPMATLPDPPGGQVSVATAIVDAHVVLNREPVQGRLYLMLLSHNSDPDAWAATVVLDELVENNFVHVFNSQDLGYTFRGDNFGDYTIWSWQKDENFVRLIVWRERILLFPDAAMYDAALTDHVVDYRPNRVRKFRVKNLVTPNTVTEVTGRPELVAGYNVDLRPVDIGESDSLISSAGPVRTRNRSRFFLDVIPGRGQGRYPTCDENLYITHINHQPPDDRGNMAVVADGCMWVDRPGTNVGSTAELTLVDDAPSLMEVHQDCTACCDCADYVALYEDIRTEWTRLTAINTSLLAARDQYDDVRDQWIAAQADQCDTLVTALRLYAKPGWQVGVHILAQNPRPCDLLDVRLSELNVVMPGGWSYSIIPGTSYMLLGGRDLQPWDPSQAMASGLTLYSGRLVLWTCELYFAKPRSVDQLLTIYASLTVGGVAAGYVQETVLLKAPFNK